MKHQHDINFVDVSTDLEDLTDKITESVVTIILVYMAADTARHILKSLI